MLAIIIAGTAALLVADTGEFNGYPAGTRKWFDRPAVVRCCAEADGHIVAWRGDRARGFWIEIQGRWVQVPDRAVQALDGQPNPFLQGVAFYVPDSNTPGGWYVRCFIPGEGG